jgi:hypothetical protein
MHAGQDKTASGIIGMAIQRKRGRSKYTTIFEDYKQ